MIIVFSGENDYELTKKVAQLQTDFDGRTERFEAADLTNEQLADIFAGQTLFDLKRLIIIDTPSANAELWKNVEVWAKRLSDDTQLVLVEPKPDKRTSTYKWLKKNVDMQEFLSFDERDTRAITAWVETYARQKSVALTAQQARHLADRVGANQWELAHAIDKLALAGEVTDQWIDDVSQASPTENVFALFETVLNGDIERLQAMLVTLRLTEEPYRLLGLMNAQALQLAVLTYGDGNVSKVAADTSAKSSYPYQKMAPYAIRLSKGQVKNMVRLLAESDMRLKQSDANPWLVLENTLVQMASRGNN
ncbi:MAG: DNA polymerase III subunit delta [Patescibacteria group bacterium]